MHDALLMRHIEGSGDLVGICERRIERQRTAADDFSERFAFDQLHHQRAVFEAVDGRDVGMVQRGEDLRLAGKASQALRFVGESGWQDFEGYMAFEYRVAGAIDFAHAARP